MPTAVAERAHRPMPIDQKHNLSLTEMFQLDQRLAEKIRDRTTVPSVFTEASSECKLTSFLPEIEPFEKGSYLKQLGPREWIMTQEGAFTPYDETYGPDNPMPMRAIHAPGAGERARNIMESGRTEDELTPQGQKVDIETSMRHTRAFIQLFAKKGTDFGGNGENIACISTGLGWDRQTRNEDAMRQMVRSVIGEGAIIVWFGSHKFLAFAKGTVDPKELRDKMVDAPIDAYRKYHPNWSDAQERIQRMRRQINTGRDFVDYYDVRNNTLEQAFKGKGDKRLSFEWLYLAQGGDVGTIDADGQRKSFLELVVKNTYVEDMDMRNMLYALWQVLPRFQGEGIVAFEGLFDPTAVCCGFSTNSQQNGLFAFEPTPIGDMSSFEMIIGPVSQYRPGEYRQHCNACGERFAGEHTCKS